MSREYDTQSRANSKAYDENYDRIFRKAKAERKERAEKRKADKGEPSEPGHPKNPRSTM